MHLFFFVFCTYKYKLTNKVHYIYYFLIDFQVSVLGISETWLTPNISDACLTLPQYTLVRKDVGVVAKHGVCIYIKSTLKFVEVAVDVPNPLVLFLSDLSLYFITVYRPPSNSTADNDNLITFLTEFCLGKDIILVGDFNLPSIRWNRDLVCLGLLPNDLKFYNCFNFLGLTQWVLEGTFYSSGNTLDLIFSSEEDRVIDVQVLPPFPNCGHSPVACKYISQHPSPSDTFSKFKL